MSAAIKLKRSLILIGHGGRSSNWAAPLRRMQAMVQQRLPDVAVELAFLEFMQPDLLTLVPQLAQRGYTEATIVPLFLGQSGQVLRDIPPMLAQLQQEYPVISLRLAKTISDNEEVLEAMAVYCAATLTEFPGK